MSTFAGSVRRSKSASLSNEAGDQSLVQAIDGIGTLCLWTIIFAVPLTMAGIRESGNALFVGCSLTMGLTWAVRQLIAPEQGSPFTAAVWIVMAALALVGLQLVPLPGGVVRLLSPFTAEYLTTWNDGHALVSDAGYWPTVTLTPSLTESAFVQLMAYATFFLVLLQRLRTLDDIDHLLKLVGISAAVMAIVGVGQMFFGNGQFLWMIDHPLRSPSWPAKGTFTNQNHFAHFLALGVGPLIWWWINSGTVQQENIAGRVSNSGFGVSRSTDSAQQMIGALIAVVFFAGVLSFSRGGILAMLSASGVCLMALGTQRTAIFRLAVPVCAFMAAGVVLFGLDGLENKWNSLAKAESFSDLCRGRFALWSALIEAAPWFWPAGSGIGSHAEIYPTWMEMDIGKRMSHAESSYLQILIEAGLPGLVLAFCGVGLCGYWLLSSWKQSQGKNYTRVTLMAASIVVAATHSLVDFVWHIPACMVATLALVACVCRTWQIYSHGKRGVQSAWPRRLAWILIFAAIPAARLSADIARRQAEAEGTWLSFRAQAIEAGKQKNFESLEALDLQLDGMVADLEKCLEADPQDFRAMSDLATLYLRRFERDQQSSANPMTVREIKNTVQNAEFESPRDVFEWLQRAFGPNVTDLYRSLLLAEKAVHGQPMRGENYLVLAQLGFLRDASAVNEEALIQQAIRLRPYEPAVLYFAGLSEAEKGRIDEACRWWKSAFHLSSGIRPLIIRGLAPHLPPAQLVEYLDPGADGLWLMFREYQSLEMQDEQQAVGRWYEQQFRALSQSPAAESTEFWTRSYELFDAMNEPEKAMFCLDQAVRKSPSDYALRKRYGFALLSVQAETAAVKELEWCQLRNPDDREITQALESVTTAQEGQP